MREQILTQAGTGTSTPLVLDQCQDPFNISLGLSWNSAGTLSTSAIGTATVQYTLDDPFVPGGWTANTPWYNSNDPNFVAATTGIASNFAFPARGVRLVQTAGTGTAVLKVVSAGITSNG